MGRDLTNLYISSSFQGLVQISGSQFTDGTGSLINYVDITASYASAADTSISSSYAITASYALNAEGTDTGSLMITGSVATNVLTFTKGDGSTFSLTVDTGSAVTVDTGSLLTTASISDATITFTKGDATTFDITVNNVVNADSASVATTATSASHAILADSATSALSASYALTATTAITAATSSITTYSANTIVYGKNLSGGTIEKGTPLYFTGSGTAGNLVGVYPADAGDPTRMPAGGVAGQQILDEAEGIVLLDGFINEVDTSAFASGDQVWVAVGGGYTNIRPTGSNNLVQPLGYVEKSAVNGSGVINGPGIERAMPNIQQDYLWVGDANGVAQPVDQSTLSVASAVSSSYVAGANVDGQVASALSASHAITASLALDVDRNANLDVASISASLATFESASIGFLQTITGSATIVGDAYVIVNTTDTTRYAGLKVYESGSVVPTTASMNFDSQTNDWFYEYTGSDPTNFGVVMFGPEYATKGSPTYLTNNTIPKGDGGHHLNDSNITDDGTLVSINANTQITGNLDVSGTITGAITADTASYVSGSSAIVQDLLVENAATFNVDTGASDYVYINGGEAFGLYLLGSAKFGDSFNNIGNQYNVFVQGERNTLTSANNAAIVGARESEIRNVAAEHDVIAGGRYNLIDVGSRSFIGGGWTNTINADDTAIIASRNSTIASGHSGSVILGGSSITTERDNVVYVPSLKIANGNIEIDSGSFSGSAIDNVTDIYPASPSVKHIVSLTQAEYNAISASSDANTLYAITDAPSTVISASYATTASYAFDAVSASFAVSASYAPLDTSLNNNWTGENAFSGSVYGIVSPLSIASNTASMNVDTGGNFFTLTLVSGSNTHLTTSVGINPGQTVSLKVKQPNPGFGTLTFDSNIKTGSAYLATEAADAEDVLTFISFDNTNLYVSAVQNLA